MHNEMVSHGEAHPMEMHDGKGKSMRHLLSPMPLDDETHSQVMEFEPDISYPCKMVTIPLK